MMMVHSANDIAVAIAETVGGSEERFVAMMNAEAARLGMSSTHFVNPNGLPGTGQYTTARDLAVLGRALWTEFPERRELYGITAIRSGQRVLKSANSLLERYPGSRGMKTGFICASGFNVVATASRGNRTLAAVVLGSPNAKDRAELAARLMNQGFESGGAATRPSLASFKGSSPVPEVINMRQEICGKKDRGENETDSALNSALPSALQPRVQLMEPVVVSILGVRKPDGTFLSPQEAEAEQIAAAEAAAAAKAAKKKGGKAAKEAAKKDGGKAASKKDSDKKAAAKTPREKPVKAKVEKAPAKPASKPKIEVGVPFDSTDFAPLPDSALAVTQ
jgi:D-alanyl-D-alanine carboxypeptidase